MVGRLNDEFYMGHKIEFLKLRDRVAAMFRLLEREKVVYGRNKADAFDRAKDYIKQFLIEARVSAARMKRDMRISGLKSITDEGEPLADYRTINYGGRKWTAAEVDFNGGISPSSVSLWRKSGYRTLERHFKNTPAGEVWILYLDPERSKYA